jgi:hypothetical protein
MLQQMLHKTYTYQASRVVVQLDHLTLIIYTGAWVLNFELLTTLTDLAFDRLTKILGVGTGCMGVAPLY